MATRYASFAERRLGKNTTETVMLRLSMKTNLLVTLLMNLAMTFVPQIDLQPENQTIDLSDQETPIYEVHDPPLNILLSPIRETDASTAHNETTNEVDGPPLNIPTSTIQ